MIVLVLTNLLSGEEWSSIMVDCSSVLEQASYGGPFFVEARMGIEFG